MDRNYYVSLCMEYSHKLKFISARETVVSGIFFVFFKTSVFLYSFSSCVTGLNIAEIGNKLVAMVTAV